MTEFLQFLVLAFTGLVWWLARRDLTANAARLRASSSAEVDRLRETVEALTAALEERVTTEEKRLSALIAEARALQSPLLPRTKREDPIPSSAPMREPVEASTPPTVTPNVVEAPAASAPVRDLAEVATLPAAAFAAADVETREEFGAPVTPVGVHLNGESGRSPAMRAVIAADENTSVTTADAGAPVIAPHADAPVIAATPPEATEDAPGIPVEVSPEPAPVSAMHLQVMESERRAALVRAQLAIGLIDPIEIARRTGLPRGEVELLIGLRALRIEPAAPFLEPTAANITPPAPTVLDAEPESSSSEVRVSELAEDDRYAAIYAMLASGVTNSTEIARRTGMGRGEVELILGLRARNVL